MRAVHQGFVDAGSDLLLTNSFGANRMRLALHGAEARVAELNRAAARLAREAGDAAGRPVLVAGDIGPTGEIFAPVGSFTAAEGEAVFAEQAAALAEGGVDLLWIETISSAEELAAAVAGAAQTGLPVVATMTFDTRGRTMMGLTCEAAMRLCDDLAVRPAAFGANCGTGPAQLVESVLGLMRAAGPGDAIVAKGNCGLPHYHDGRDPLRRHARDHGGLRLPGARCRRAHHRRLLRHDAAAHRGDGAWRWRRDPRAPRPTLRRSSGRSGRSPPRPQHRGSARGGATPSSGKAQAAKAR